MRPILKFLCVLSLVFVNAFAWGQEITGIVIDAQTGDPIEGARVSIAALSLETTSNEAGLFRLATGVPGQYVLSIESDDYTLIEQDVEATDGTVHAGIIRLTSQSSFFSQGDELDAILISESELDDEDGRQEVSSLLTASRDVFGNRAAFNLSAARFRIRGYSSESSLVYLNGAPVSDLEDGRVQWSSWGGLNDMFRLRQTQLSLGLTPFSFGAIGGAQNVDLRASVQRKQIRASYAISNRSYRNRLMLTYSTGPMDNGWSISLSGSRRWAQEGFIDATSYDAWSYFASIEKKLSDAHALNLVVLGAPTKRGRSGPSVQEMLDIAGTNYYNPYWGFQEGEKRNSRVYDSHQPLGILRHDWQLGENSTLTTSVLYQTGEFGSSSLDWYNAADPRPDYWRRLPSGQNDDLTAQRVRDTLRSNQALRQINWTELYNSNRINETTIRDVDGIAGNDVTGFLSNYIVQEQHFDADKLVFHSNLQSALSDRVNLSAGINYTSETNHLYRKVLDLLGGQFYIDYDKFAERDFPGNTDIIQNDLNRPNRLLDVGDRFGYDYDLNIRKAQAWAMTEFVLPQFDIMFGVDLSRTEFWREGFTRTGKFPENSFGESEKQSFTNLGVKGGLTYKINGRNYVYANGLYATRAPFARNAYLSPRTRDQLVEGLDSETLYSGELGYIIRFPAIKGRLTGYYSRFEDQINVRSFFHDDLNSFVNFTLTGVDKKHMGLEAAVELKLTPQIGASAVAAIGQYTFDSRPMATISQDNNAELLDENVVIYQKDFRVPGTPQRAFSVGLSYNSPHFWFASVNFNYFDDIYLDFNPVRRTIEGIAPIDVENQPDLVDDILQQQQLDSDYTLDFFGGKSWKVGNYFLYLNAGVNNILNNTDFRTGGFEQLRFDFDTKDVNQFPPRYFYAYGTNYFISLTFRY